MEYPNENEAYQIIDGFRRKYLPILGEERVNELYQVSKERLEKANTYIGRFSAIRSVSIQYHIESAIAHFEKAKSLELKLG